jgi:glycosyltransferase involved in cell wall biosynthesis
MGGMSGEAEVADEAKKLNLPITFFKPDNGFLSAKDYYAKIKKARMLFAPSHEEGWGIAVCEAMAAGLPVIAYDLPAYRKIYSDSYKAIECFNHEMFAKAIIDILDNTSAYSDLKAKGIATAAKYDWDEIAENDRDFLL